MTLARLGAARDRDDGRGTARIGAHKRCWVVVSDAGLVQQQCLSYYPIPLLVFLFCAGSIEVLLLGTLGLLHDRGFHSSSGMAYSSRICSSWETPCKR